MTIFELAYIVDTIHWHTVSGQTPSASC